MNTPFPCKACGDIHCNLPVRNFIKEPSVHDSTMPKGQECCAWCGCQTIPGRMGRHYPKDLPCHQYPDGVDTDWLAKQFITFMVDPQRANSN